MDRPPNQSLLLRLNQIVELFLSLHGLNQCSSFTLLSSFLGLQVKQTNNNGKIEITLTNMIEETHAKFKKYMGGTDRRHNTPMRAGTQLQPATDEEFKAAQKLPYQALIGCLCFIISWVKVEASTALSILGSHTSKWNYQYTGRQIAPGEYTAQLL